MKFKYTIILLVIIILILGGFLIFYFKKSIDFETDLLLIKLTAKQGDLLEDSLSIKNTGSRGNFILDSDLDFISIKEKEFLLDKAQEKKIKIILNANKEPGIYIGKILIIKNKKSFTIPVILEIETEEVLFDGVINIVNEKAVPREKLIFENKIFNLENIGSKKIKINYFLRDLNNEIFSETEEIVVENNLVLRKTIQLPKNTKKGNYIFGFVLQYKNSIGIGSYFFEISDKEFEISSFYLTIFVLVLFIIVILFIIYSFKERNKLLLELNKQRRKDLNKVLNKLNKKEKVIKKNRPDKKKIKKIKKERKKKIREINRIHKKRKKLIKKLKKEKNINEIDKKLKEWKIKGIDVNEYFINAEKKFGLKKRRENYERKGYKL